MAGNNMVPTSSEGNPKMAKSSNKSFSSKSAGGQKVQAGPSGKMHKFAGAGAQKPGVSATTEHKGKGAAFVKGGPSGKMHGFTAVKAQKPGRSSQS